MELYEFYAKHHKTLLSFATKYTQRQDAARDLLQDAYVKAMEHEDLFTTMHEMQMRGWFFQVIKRLFIDQYRKDKRLVHMEEEAMNFEPVASGEEEVIMYMVLDILPPIERKIIEYKYYQGYNSKEIGEKLHLSPSTVRSKLQKSLLDLRRELDRRDDHENYY